MKRTIVIFHLILTTAACFQSRTKPEYIFLITLDTVRDDHVLVNRKNNELTPHLDALASEGMYFNKAYALIPITLPSHYAIFYSRHPYQLQIYNNGQTARLRCPSLTETLKKNGYSTKAVISLGSVGKKWGLGKGFDEYIENYRRPYLWYKTAAQVNEDAFRLIKETPEERAFFWIHYSDPHEPYFPPEYKGEFTLSFNGKTLFTCLSRERSLIKKELVLSPGENVLVFKTVLPEQFHHDPKLDIEGVGYENFTLDIPEKQKTGIEIRFPPEWTRFQSLPGPSTMKLINHSSSPVSIGISFIYRLLLTQTAAQNLYKEEIRYMDHHIGELIHFIKSKGLYEKSCFIIMGDHGEGLGEYRDHTGHIHYLNKIFTKVPLILAGAGIPRKSVRSQLASNLNIAPTVLDLADIPQPTSMLGTSLLKSEKDRKLLLETYAPEAYSDGFSLIDYPYQIIFYPGREEERWELIHLKNDFAGIDNIFTSAGPRVKNRMIQSIRNIVPDLLEAKKNETVLSQKDREILKSLGYIK